MLASDGASSTSVAMCGNREVVSSYKHNLFTPVASVVDMSIADHLRHNAQLVAMDVSSNSSYQGSSNDCSMVNCAIDEALMEISEDSMMASPIPACNNATFIDHPSDDKNYTSTFEFDGLVDNTKNNQGYSVMSLASCNSQTEYNPSEEDNNNMMLFPNNVNVTTINVQTSQVLDAPAPVRKRSVATMTIEEDLLSQRERFYLQQIQTLQEEKMSLRRVGFIELLASHSNIVRYIERLLEIQHRTYNFRYK